MNEADFEVLRERAQRLVDEVLIPDERRMEEEGCISAPILARMRALGLFGISIPPELGGVGLSLEQEASLMFVLGRAASSYRAAYALNNGGGSLAILADGTEEQKRRYLPRLAAGELLAAFALTEPQAGSDAQSLTTTATRVAGGYVLRGVKSYVMHGSNADLIIVMARTGTTESARAEEVSAFIVDTTLAGVRHGERLRTLGLRGTQVCTVTFDDVRLAPDALIGEVEGRGFRSAMRSIEKARIHVAAVCIGLAERAIDLMSARASERRQFGRAIGEFQFIQEHLAASYSEIYAARCAVLDAARARDRGERVGERAAAVKLFASEACYRTADRAVQVFGAAGYTDESKAELLLRDARLYRIIDGTSEIQKLVIARALLARHARPAEEK